VAASIEREREVLCPGSDGLHVNAAWHDLPQVLLVSSRTGSLFYSPESNLTVWEEAPAPDLYLTYLSLNVECPFKRAIAVLVEADSSVRLSSCSPSVPHIVFKMESDLGT